MAPAPRPRALAATSAPAIAALAALAVCAACAPSPATPAPPLDVHLVLTERWAQGGRLVVVDDAGDRQAVLVAPPAGPPTAVRDEQAAFSPDGRWIAFASTRGGDLDHTALWLVAARAGAEPVRLTDPGHHDVSPAWTPDGRALVFASDRGGFGSFQLYRLELGAALASATPAAALPAPRALTSAGLDFVAPTVAADGRLVSQVITRGLAPTSYLALVDDSGLPQPLTDGPDDATPAWAPDGRHLAYASRRPHAGGGDDVDLFMLDTARDRPPVVLAALPATDESGPVFSRDGRWLFATSVALGPDGEPLFSSVIVIDLRDPTFAPRMLRDQVGAIVRAGPALAPVPLDEVALRRAPPYGDALAQALRELEEARAAAAAATTPPAVLPAAPGR
ncbi:MAG TPA: hypothetical protein VHE35_10485 [Kofleriaceae bacterium]|nr:hypothetical protein [Kofleriaceae bacterium]